MLSASSFSNDNNLYIYHLNRPYIPIYVIKGHTNTITGFHFSDAFNQESVITCSKDGTVMLQKISDAYRPYCDLQSSVVAFSPKGTMVTCKQEFLHRNPDNFLSEVDTPETAQKQLMTQNITIKHYPQSIINSQINISQIIFLAKNYMLTGDFKHICKYNKKISSQIQRKDLMELWRNLQRWLITDKDFNIFHSKTSIQHPSVKKSPSNQQLEVLLKSNTEGIIKEKAPIGTNYSNDFSPEIDDDKQLTYLLQKMEETVQPVQPQQPQKKLQTALYTTPKPNKQIHKSTSAGDSQIEMEEQEGNSPIDFTEEDKAHYQESLNADWNQKLKLITEMYKNSLIQSISYYAEVGDIQTACILITIIGNIHNLNIYQFLSEEQIINIYMAYFQLLKRLKLYPQIAELIKATWVEKIQQISKKQNQFYLACGKCKKTLLDESEQLNPQQDLICENCQTQNGICSLCQQVVKGLYMSCQVCCHGGHLDHLYEWFQTQELCPTGCGHKCRNKNNISEKLKEVNIREEVQ